MKPKVHTYGLFLMSTQYFFYKNWGFGFQILSVFLVFIIFIFYMLFLEKKTWKDREQRLFRILKKIKSHMKRGSSLKESFSKIAKVSSQEDRLIYELCFDEFIHTHLVKSNKIPVTFMKLVSEIRALSVTIFDPIQELNELIRVYHFEKEFRRKSVNLCLNLRIQAQFLSVFFIPIWFYVQIFEKEFPLKLTFLSLFLFLFGFFIVLKIGKSFSWEGEVKDVHSQPTPPLMVLISEIKKHVYQGKSVIKTMEDFCEKNETCLSKKIKIFVFKKQKNLAINYFSKLESIELAYDLAEWILESQSVGFDLEVLNQFEVEARSVYDNQIDRFLQKLPFRLMVPVLLFQFPALMILILGVPLHELVSHF